MTLKQISSDHQVGKKWTRTPKVDLFSPCKRSQVLDFIEVFRIQVDQVDSGHGLGGTSQEIRGVDSGAVAGGVYHNPIYIYILFYVHLVHLVHLKTYFSNEINDLAKSGGTKWVKTRPLQRQILLKN